MFPAPSELPMSPDVANYAAGLSISGRMDGPHPRFRKALP